MDIKQIRLENLEQLISEAPSMAALARSAKLSSAYLSQLRGDTKTMKGTTRGMGDDAARKLEKAAGKPRGWMDVRHGTVAEPSTEYSSNLHDDRIALQSEVPLISSVQAGQWNDIMDMYYPGDGEELIPTTKRVSSGSFALRVSGDSMTCDGPGSIYEGMIVIVDPQVEPLNGRIVVAKLKSSQEATIKKLVIDGPNGYLMPLNKRYSPIPIDDDCLIIGTVVKVEFDI